QPSRLGVQCLSIRDVPTEGVLCRYRDLLDVQLEIARVDSARAVSQERADHAGEQGAKIRVGQRGESPDGRDAASLQPFLRPWPDPREHADRERREESRLPTRRDYGDAARLAPVGGDLG